MYVPSLELGLPHPFSRKQVCPPPGPKGGGAHSPAAKGVRESQFQRLEKRLALCLLCGCKYFIPVREYFSLTDSFGRLSMNLYFPYPVKVESEGPHHPEAVEGVEPQQQHQQKHNKTYSS